MPGAIPPFLCYPFSSGFLGSFSSLACFELFVCLSHTKFKDAAQGTLHSIYDFGKMKDQKAFVY
jgi:hypothetical protein